MVVDVDTGWVKLSGLDICNESDSKDSQCRNIESIFSTIFVINISGKIRLDNDLQNENIYRIFIT